MLDKIKRFANKNRLCFYIVLFLFWLSGIGVSLVCYIMRIYPIKDNKIVCCNMKGKRYGDNPKYISDEIIRRGLDFDIVWLLNENVKEDLPLGVRRVNNSFWYSAYELATAKIWIDSNTKSYGIKKRKGQLYIQTWHGSYGLKKVYGDLEKISPIDRKYMQYNSKIEDLMISNSYQTTEIYRRAFWYKGRVLECGSPRNDIFFGEQNPYTEKVKKHFKIAGKNIALYAPTYRDSLKVDSFDLDYKKLKRTLEKKFGGEWAILIRLHPHNMIDAERFIAYSSEIINATDYSVMQELLVASDVLITDYSSCMFDFVTTGKTCFLYATDVEAYREERDYYFDLDELPFPLAQNNDELEKNILNFDEEKYQNELKQLFERVGLCESGDASGQVVDYIENWVRGNNK